MSALGDKLAEARNQRGWTLREVERRTGLHNAHISQIETGAIGRPAPNVLWTFAELYGLDYQELLRLAGHIQPSTGHGATGRSPIGAALRAMGDLTPDEQAEVLEYIENLRKLRRSEDD